jgi:putative phosphoesterase
MKIGIVSDIHCNIAGLDRALAAMGDVDELICAGDAIYQFRFSNEVAARLRERGARIIHGNHEETFFSRDGVRAQAAPWIDTALRDFLAAQPLDLRVRVNGKRLLVVHGSPFEPRGEYVYPNSPTLRRCAEIDDAEIVILGHTHYQMAERVGRVLVINPGSAGEARDPRNDFQLSFAILDTQTDEVRFGNFADPARAASGSADLTMTVWTPPGGNTGNGYDQAPKAGQASWNGSPNA